MHAREEHSGPERQSSSFVIQDNKNVLSMKITIKKALFYWLSNDLNGSAYGDHKIVSVKINTVLFFNSIKKMSRFY